MPEPLRERCEGGGRTKPETVGELHHGSTPSLKLSQYPWSQRGPPRRPQSVKITAWVGAKTEAAHELTVAVVAEREALLKLKSLRSLTLSQNSW